MCSPNVHLVELRDLEALCHKITVKPGETYFVPGGCPHALGAGCFVAEIQEPSDLGAIAIPQSELIDYRRKAAPGAVFTPIDEALYEKRTLGSFIYEGASREQILDRCISHQPVIRKGDGYEERSIFDHSYSAYFSCSLCTVDGGRMPYENADSVTIGIVLDGSGIIRFPGGELEIHQGDELFFPFHTTDAVMEGKFTMILCRPG